MSKKLFASLCCCVLLAFSAPRTSFATTVNLTLDSANDSPYVFDISTSSNDVDLSCLNDNRNVSIGESWTATAENLESMITNPSHNPTDGTLSLTDLKEDAYLDSKYSSTLTSIANQEIQDAIWSILDGHDVYTGLATSGSSRTTEDNAVQTYISNAIGSVSTETASFYSEFTFYAPVVWGNNNDCWQGSIPQEFLGYNGAATPEPSSLVLLGTGIIGLAGAMRLRMKASKQA